MVIAFSDFGNSERTHEDVDACLGGFLNNGSCICLYDPSVYATVCGLSVSGWVVGCVNSDDVSVLCGNVE